VAEPRLALDQIDDQLRSSGGPPHELL
jgi:hypothetical protein